MDPQQVNGWDDSGDFTPAQADVPLDPESQEQFKNMADAYNTTPDRLIASAKKAVATGVMSPAQVKAHLQKHSVKPDLNAPNFGPPTLDKMAPPPGNTPDTARDQTPEVVTAKRIVPASDANAVATTASGLSPGQYEQESDKDTDQTKQSDTTKKFLDPTGAMDAADIFSQLPMNKENLRSIDELQNRVNMLSRLPRQDWVKPLVALADSQTGSHLMAGYTPPANQTDLLKYEDELAKRHAQMSQDFNHYLTASNIGTMNDSNMLMNQYNQMSGEKIPFTNPLQLRQMVQDRRDFTTLMNRIDQDIPLRNQIQPLYQMSNAMHILNSGITDPKAFNEAQNMLRTAIQTGSGSRSIGDERQATYLHDLGMDADSVMQYLSGNMQYLNSQDPKVVHLRQLGQLSENSVTANLKNRLGQVTEGRTGYFDNPGNEWMAPQLQNKLHAYLGGGSDQINQAAASLPAPAAKASSKKASGGGASGMVAVIAPDGRKGKMSVADFKKAVAAGKGYKRQ